MEARRFCVLLLSLPYPDLNFKKKEKKRRKQQQKTHTQKLSILDIKFSSTGC